MFFDNAAAGAQRERRRLVSAFGVEHRRERERGRGRIGQVIRREVDEDEVACPVGAQEQRGLGFGMGTGTDLSGKVQADVENLAGIGEDGWKGRHELEAYGTGFGLELGK